MILFIIFVIIPLIEISLFMLIGGEIGIFKTLFLCLLTAVIGGIIIRQQGLQTLFSARSALNRGQTPLQEFFDGICIAVSGAMLLTPGFFTDIIGFSLLVPFVRRLLQAEMIKRFGLTETGFSGQKNSATIEVEYERVEPSDKT